MELESPSLIYLAQQLRNIEGVEQVRYHNVVKQRFKDMVGEDGVSVVCLVPNRFIPGKYIKFVTILTKQSVEDVETHPSVIDSVTQRINKYLIHNIRPASF